MYFECQLSLVQKLCPNEVAEKFATAIGLLGDSIEEARRLISEQRPLVLDEYGLCDAIEHLVFASRQQGGQEIEYSHDEPFPRLASSLEATIFRIVQEGLANARRHSQSNKVHVRLIRRNDSVCVEIEDWGVGFDPETAKQNHFGVEGLHHRARLFGGHAEIDSRIGQGTCIAAEFPVSQHEKSSPHARKPSVNRDAAEN